MREGVIAIDLDYRIVSWSSGAERLLGWQEDEVVGRLAFPFLAPCETAAEFRTFLAHFATPGRPPLKRERPRKDGSIVYVSASISVVRDQQGTPTGYLSVFRDISAEKREERRQIDEARLRGLAERMNEAELVVTLDGVIVEANERAAA
jgi:PAS domain S-box-containing protein